MPILHDQPQRATTDSDRRQRERFRFAVFAVLITSGIVLLTVLLYAAHHTSLPASNPDPTENPSSATTDP
jgi:hypothetical protein